MIKEKQKTLIWLLIIFVITLLVYSPGFQAEFTNFDDNRYVTENPMVWELSGENINKIFTTYYDGHYHPITLLSIAVDYSLTGMKPWLFHFVNILFHLLNTILVFYFIKKLFSNFNIAIVASFLFGIHTFHVESVVWIAERKDVLFAFFFLLSLISYLKYYDSSKYKFLILSIILFVLSCLSKGQAVALAPTLLAIDYLKGRQLLSKKVILEKLPFFALAIFFGIIAMKAHETFPYIGQTTVPLFDRLVYACFGFILYIYKLIIPVDLSAYYPYPSGAAGGIDLIFPVLALTFAGIIIWKFKKNKPLVFGMLFFIINLALVLKIFQVHLQTGKFVIADRYSYIPSIGFFFIIGYYFDWFIKKYPAKKIGVTIVLGVWMIMLSIMTFNRSGVWKDSITLWNNVIDQYPELSWAYGKRGLAKAGINDVNGAIQDYTLAIKYDPKDPHAYNNRGNLFASRFGDLDKALIDLNNAIEVGPKFFEAYTNRGLVRFYKGDLEGALKDLNYSVEIMPTYAVTFYNRGHVLSSLEKYEEAINDYNEAFKLNPRLIQVHLYRGIAYSKSGYYKEGLADLNKVLAKNSKHPLALFHRADCYQGVGRMNEAMHDLDLVIKLSPGNYEALYKRGNLIYNRGAIPKAIEDYKKAIAINPEYGPAYYSLTIALSEINEMESASYYLKKADSLNIKIDPELLKSASNTK